MGGCTANTIKQIALNILDVGVETHFWYMNALIMLYIMTPFLSKLIKSLSDRQLLLFVILSVLFQELRIVLEVFGIKWSYLFDFMVFSWTVYFILGFFIKKYGEKYRYLIYILSLIGLGINLYLNTMENDVWAKNIYDLRITMVFISVGIFAFFCFDYKKTNNAIVSYIIKLFAKYSFSIYMIHFCSFWSY